MFSLEKKINTEQRFANLVYKDFQTKRFGLTPCCDVEIEEIKLKKYLCDYQELKDYDDTLLPTEDLDIIVIDCDDLPLEPIPTPPDDTPVIDPVACRSLDFDGVDEFLEYTTVDPLFYDFVDYNKNHSLSFWFQYKAPPSNAPADFQGFYPVFTKLDVFQEKGFVFAINSYPSPQIAYGLFNGNAGVSTYNLAPYSFIDGEWYNVTWTSDGLSSYEIYVNGVVQPNTTYYNNIAATVHTLTTPYQVAAITTTSEKRELYAEFVAHSIRGWDVILTPAEVLTEFNSGVRLPVAVQSGNLKLDIQMYNSVWNPSALSYAVPEVIKGVNFISFDMEQIDLLNICPE